MANRNSFEYSPHTDRTTSYVVTVYSARGALPIQYQYADQEIVYFAGDSYLGRWFTKPLADPNVVTGLARYVRDTTGGAPLIVNFEGVVLDNPPDGLSVDFHVMHAELAVPILQRLNIRAASLANNHGFDLGQVGIEESASILRRSGIIPMSHGAITDLGSFRLLTLNFVRKRGPTGYPLVHAGDLERLCRSDAKPPLIAFVHWGRGYTNTAASAEYAAAEALHNCGVGAILGAHSHSASSRLEALQGGEYLMAYSLGNFLFDQDSTRTSGSLIELRIFRQGSFAARLVPIGNLFELGNRLLRREAQGEETGSGAGRQELPLRRGDAWLPQFGVK